MYEIVPLVGGLIVGALLWWVPTRYRLVVGVIASFAVGALSTIVSGEYLVSWKFLLFDVPLAALGIAAGYLGVRQLAARSARQRASGT